jgi:hypothetical protein
VVVEARDRRGGGSVLDGLSGAIDAVAHKVQAPARAGA